MKKMIMPFVLAVIVFAACKKGPSKNEANTIVAKIEYNGDPAADGLGWILVTDTVNRKIEIPENMPDAYKIAGLIVDVNFVRTDKDAICFCVTPPKLINITAIAKHNE